jgi:hypothetical protein
LDNIPSRMQATSLGALIAHRAKFISDLFIPDLASLLGATSFVSSGLRSLSRMGRRPMRGRREGQILMNVVLEGEQQICNVHAARV